MHKFLSESPFSVLVEWNLLRTPLPPFANSVSPLCSFPQNLVEAAEEADLNHEFNESLVVSPPAPGDAAERCYDSSPNLTKGQGHLSAG